MPTPTEGHSTDTDALVLDRAAHGYWVPGPNANWRVAGSPTGDGKAFTRTHLASVIAAHHAAIHGGDTHAASAEFDNAGRGTAQTTFYKQLPGEVKRYLQGNPAALNLFHVTHDASEAGGADALGDLGDDKYFQHIDRLHGSSMEAALETARTSEDPAMRYAAAVHDNMPETRAALLGKATKAEKAAHPDRLKAMRDAADRAAASGDLKRATKMRNDAKSAEYAGRPEAVGELRRRADDTKEVQTVDAKRLNVGHQFTHGGIVHRVVEDADGHRVLASEHGEFPLEALDAVAVDQGSLRKGKVPKMVPDDVAPFSAAEPPDGWLLDPTALQLSADKPPVIGHRNGFPVYEVWTDALVCGDYRHPVTGQRFSIDRARLARCVSSLTSMLSAGIDSPVVRDHKEQSANALGWVKGARVDGDRLKLKTHIVGDDGLLEAARNKVSVKLQGCFTDSKGRKYSDAITHLALTPIPVIHDLNGFSIAASGAQPANLADGVPSVFLLSAEPLSQRTTDMPLTSEQIDRVRKLPGADTVTEEGAADFLLSYAESAGQHLVTLRDEKDLLLSQVATATEKVEEALKLSRATETAPALPDDATLMLLSRAAESEWAGVKAAGYPAPLIADLKALFRDDNKPNALSLSRDHGGADPLEFMVTGLLAKHKTDASGLLQQVTPEQNGLTLSRDAAKGDGDDADSLKKKMIAMANGKGKPVTGMAKMCKDD